jgi:hypothetical protein
MPMKPSPVLKQPGAEFPMLYIFFLRRAFFPDFLAKAFMATRPMRKSTMS